MENMNISAEYFYQLSPYIGRRVYLELYSTDSTHDLYDLNTDEFLCELPDKFCTDTDFCSSTFKDLIVVCYKNSEDIVNISIEDEDTNEVIFSFDHDILG